MRQCLAIATLSVAAQAKNSLLTTNMNLLAQYSKSPAHYLSLIGFGSDGSASGSGSGSGAGSTSGAGQGSGSGQGSASGRTGVNVNAGADVDGETAANNAWGAGASGAGYLAGKAQASADAANRAAADAAAAAKAANNATWGANGGVNGSANANASASGDVNSDGKNYYFTTFELNDINMILFLIKILYLNIFYIFS